MVDVSKRLQAQQIADIILRKGSNFACDQPSLVIFIFWNCLLLALNRIFVYTVHTKYDSWIGADLAPRHFEPGVAFGINLLMIEWMTNLIERVGLDKIQSFLDQDGNTPKMYEKLTEVFSN